MAQSLTIPSDTYPLTLKLTSSLRPCNVSKPISPSNCLITSLHRAPKNTLCPTQHNQFYYRSFTLITLPHFTRVGLTTDSNSNPCALKFMSLLLIPLCNWLTFFYHYLLPSSHVRPKPFKNTQHLYISFCTDTPTESSANNIPAILVPLLSSMPSSAALLLSLVHVKFYTYVHTRWAFHSRLLLHFYY